MAPLCWLSFRGGQGGSHAPCGAWAVVDVVRAPLADGAVKKPHRRQIGRLRGDRKPFRGSPERLVGPSTQPSERPQSRIFGRGDFFTAPDARGSVEVRGEEEESAGAHRFCDLAEGRLPPGGVVRQGAISWVMFWVSCWFCLGLCWVYVWFFEPGPESDVLCFQSLLGYIHRMELFGAFSALWRAFATWGGGRVCCAGAGGSKSKGLVLLDAEQALTLSLYQVVKERMAVMGVNLLILCGIECCDWRGLTPAAGGVMMRVCSM